MTSARVERMLDEIAHLSEQEREELLGALPSMLHRASPVKGTLTPDVLAQARAFRDRVRGRLRAEGASLGSIEEDLELIREQRSAELDPSQGEAQSGRRLTLRPNLLNVSASALMLACYCTGCYLTSVMWRLIGSWANGCETELG